MKSCFISLMYDMPFFVRFLATLFGLGVALFSSSSVEVGGIGILLLATLIISLLNLILKPIIVLLVLPLVVLTLGLGLWVINALLVMLTVQILPGFTTGGWGGAFWCALWISVFTIFFLLLTGKGTIQYQQIRTKGPGFRKKVKDDDDVIDI